MINTAQIQVQAMMKELKAQRDALADRAVNLAIELDTVKAEKQLLESELKNLKEIKANEAEN